MTYILTTQKDAAPNLGRFTLAEEWAYAASYLSDEARAATYPAWLHNYNHHRPHTGIGGSTPAQRAHNVTGKYS